MTDRWKIQLQTPKPWAGILRKQGHHVYRFVGTKGWSTVLGDTIADVMNGIAYREGEQP